MTDLASILIPAYNAERWIGDTIRSALGQSWPHTEVVVVDDGSTDGTLDVCRRLEGPRVKVLTQPNGGAYAARNRAFEAAQGHFIQWLDCDDLLHTEKIARQMKVAHALADPRILLSGAHGFFYHRPERAKFVRTSLWRDFQPLDYYLTKFNDGVWLQTDTWLVSRELTEAAGPWLKTRSPDDDGEYFCRVISKSAGVKFVEGALAYFRIGNGTSLGHGRSPEALQSLVETILLCIRYMNAFEESPRTRAAAVHLLQLWYPEFLVAKSPLAAEIERLATEFGGALQPPLLKWKYRPARWLLGYSRALTLSHTWPRTKAKILREWDRAFYRLSGRSSPQLDSAHHLGKEGE